MHSFSSQEIRIWALSVWVTVCKFGGSACCRYFIFADITLVVQYLYYGTLQRRRLRAARNQQYRLRHMEVGIVFLLDAICQSSSSCTYAHLKTWNFGLKEDLYAEQGLAQVANLHQVLPRYSCVDMGSPAERRIYLIKWNFFTKRIYESIPSRRCYQDCGFSLES